MNCGAHTEFWWRIFVRMVSGGGGGGVHGGGEGGGIGRPVW